MKFLNPPSSSTKKSELFIFTIWFRRRFQASMAAEMICLQAANASMKANLQEATAEIGKQKRDALQAPKWENGHKKKLLFLELGGVCFVCSWMWINEYVEEIFIILNMSWSRFFCVGCRLIEF